MSDKDDAMTVTVVEPQGGIEEGQNKGTIVGHDVESYELDDGDEVQYLKVAIQTEGTDFEFTPSWSLNGGNIHENTALGRILEQFGVDLEAERDEDLDLSDVFGIGQQVTFHAGENPDGFVEIIDETLTTPESDYEAPDDPTPEWEQNSGSSSDSDGQQSIDDSASGESKRDQVREIVEEAGASGMDEAMQAVAKENGELVPVVNDMDADDLGL